MNPKKNCVLVFLLDSWDLQHVQPNVPKVLALLKKFLICKEAIDGQAKILGARRTTMKSFICNVGYIASLLTPDL